jgi:rfaE bifunctional protein kinase chain/domain
MHPKQAIELIEKFPSSALLVFGDVMLDSDIDCETLGVANEAPVPLLEMSQEISRPGGAANVASNLGHLGVRTHLVGAVGNDRAAEIIGVLLQEAGVSFHPLVSDRLTTHKTRVRSGSHYFLRIDEEDPSALTGEELGAVLEIVRGLLAEVEILLVSDYDKGMVCPASAVALEALARTEGRKIFADLKPKNVASWHHLDLITPNLAEAQTLHRLKFQVEANGHDKAQLARALSQALDCDLVLKLAGNGLLTATPMGQVTHLQALCQTPQNVAGAGDTVLATLAAALANGASLEDSACLANVAAAIAVSQPGPHAVSSEELAQHFRMSPG